MNRCYFCKRVVNPSLLNSSDDFICNQHKNYPDLKIRNVYKAASPYTLYGVVIDNPKLQCNCFLDSERHVCDYYVNNKFITTISFTTITLAEIDKFLNKLPKLLPFT